MMFFIATVAAKNKNVSKIRSAPKDQFPPPVSIWIDG